MAGKKGLTDSQRTGIGFAVTAVIAIALYMATLPEDQRPPEWVYGIFGGIVVIAQLAKDYLGVREVAVSVKAKAVDTRAKVDKKFGDLGKEDVASQPVV